MQSIVIQVSTIDQKQLPFKEKCIKRYLTFIFYALKENKTFYEEKVFNLV